MCACVPMPVLVPAFLLKLFTHLRARQTRELATFLRLIPDTCRKQLTSSAHGRADVIYAIHFSPSPPAPFLVSSCHRARAFVCESRRQSLDRVDRPAPRRGSLNAPTRTNERTSARVYAEKHKVIWC